MHNRLSPHEVTTDVSCTVANFSPNLNLRLGDADSNHGVVFGNLDGYGDVAVKPHFKSQRAQRELETLGIAVDRGLDAVDPIMVAEGELSSYLITRHRPGLSHLGQTDWAVSAESPAIGSIIEPALEIAAVSIARRHNRRLVKLDSQVKNIVVDETGMPVHVDAEATLVDVPIEGQTRHGNYDLRNLGCSALYRGLLAEKSPAYRAGFVVESFVDPYLEEADEGLFVDPPDVRRQTLYDTYADFHHKAQ